MDPINIPPLCEHFSPSTMDPIYDPMGYKKISYLICLLTTSVCIYDWFSCEVQ